MKPNDANGKLPPDDRPFRVLVLAGSDRRQYDCPGIDSKARALMFRMGDRLPQEWEIDLEDLGTYGTENRSGPAMLAFRPRWRCAFGHVTATRREAGVSRT